MEDQKQNQIDNQNYLAIQQECDKRVFLTIKLFCDRHPAFRPGGLRHIIFHEKINGLATSGAIIRLGGKVLIHESKFFDWVESQNREKIA